jgi:hypothetical protein
MFSKFIIGDDKGCGHSMPLSTVHQTYHGGRFIDGENQLQKLPHSTIFIRPFGEGGILF